MTRRNLFGIALAAALAAAGCDGTAQTAPEAKPRGVPVRTVTVEQRDLQDEVVLTGTLRPRAQVQVVAEVAARLLQIRRDECARAAQGEVLAVLDPTDFRLNAERSRASLAVAEANQAHARVEKDRADNLLKTGGITDKDRLAAEVNLQVADAALAQARAETSIANQHARAPRSRLHSRGAAKHGPGRDARVRHSLHVRDDRARVPRSPSTQRQGAGGVGGRVAVTACPAWP